MFDPEFYPTSYSIAKYMIKPYNIRNSIILEPSAGKGDLLLPLKNWKDDKLENVYVMEKNPELAKILKQSGYNYIGHDFLEYSDNYEFDLILMNPPFSNGDKHLLKAWEIISETGGDIACLLNYETINNPYSKSRKELIEIINQNGTIENLGKCFSDAERKTDVEVALVRLHKDKVKKSDIFDSIILEKDTSFDYKEEFSENMPASIDMIESIVSHYNSCIRIAKEKIKLSKRYYKYVSSVEKYITKGELESGQYNFTVSDDFAKENNRLKCLFWRMIFDKIKIAPILTSNLRKKFDSFIQEQSNVSFSYNNIKSVIEMFVINREIIIKESIMEVFWEIVKYHFGWSVYKEGWKSNSCYKINKHIVIPNGVKYDNFFGFSTEYHTTNIFNDIDIILSYLSGENYDKDNTIVNSLENGFRKYGKINTIPYPIFESQFFNIKYFKKGTVHLIFKDQKYCDMFNKFVANNYNYIPKHI